MKVYHVFLHRAKHAAKEVQRINTSEIRVSVLLDEGDVDRAVRAIHAKFFDEI